MQPYFDNLQQVCMSQTWGVMPFQSALSQYRGFKEYGEAKEALNKELFWQIGEYEATLEVDFDKRTSQFKFSFTVNKDEFEALKYNLTQTLDSYIYRMYGSQAQFKSVQIEVKEEK